MATWIFFLSLWILLASDEVPVLQIFRVTRDFFPSVLGSTGNSNAKAIVSQDTKCAALPACLYGTHRRYRVSRREWTSMFTPRHHCYICTLVLLLRITTCLSVGTKQDVCKEQRRLPWSLTLQHCWCALSLVPSSSGSCLSDAGGWFLCNCLCEPFLGGSCTHGVGWQWNTLM